MDLIQNLENYLEPSSSKDEWKTPSKGTKRGSEGENKSSVSPKGNPEKKARPNQNEDTQNKKIIVYMKITKGGDITQKDPKLVKKSLEDQFQPLEKIERAGKSLKIFCKSEDQKQKLMKGGLVLDSFPIEVTEPRHAKIQKSQAKISARKTTSRGVIYNVPLDISEEEILEASGAIKVTRIKKWDGTRKINTGTIFLDFEGETTPKQVKYEWLLFRVKPWINEPVRCYNCQKYGHMATKCTSKPVCSKCAGEHDSRNCTNDGPTKCTNCKDSHPASSKNCPKYIKIKTNINNDKAHENGGEILQEKGDQSKTIMCNDITSKQSPQSNKQIKKFTKTKSRKSFTPRRRPIKNAKKFIKIEDFGKFCVKFVSIITNSNESQIIENTISLLSSSFELSIEMLRSAVGLGSD